MLKRTLVAATVIAAAMTSVRAAERATFVLTDGSRHSGEVVFHGSGNRNLIDNHLNLGEGGRESTYPVDQVVMIDFAGGEPTAADFAGLATAQEQVIVLRNVGPQRGQLANLVNGDTVQWEGANGQSQQFAIRDVARIYLDPAAARRIFPQLANAAPAATATSGNAGLDDPVAPRGSIRVRANEAWTSTGVRVMKGQRVSFSATGEAQFSTDAGHRAGPDGSDAMKSPNYPVPAMPVGGLIGKVGDSAPFPIGSNREPIVMPASGQLMLGVNDDFVTDNTGGFVVTLSNARGR